MSTVQSKCYRCQQELPEGQSFCIACGCDNSAAMERRLELEGQADARVYRAKLLSRFFRFWRVMQFYR